MRIAALGDSITLGIGDPARTGGWRGWAALLAESLSDNDFRNFAAAGAVSRTVATDQLPRAVSWRPDVATVLVGVNDALRGSFDIKAIGGHLNQTLTALRDAGATPVTACLPEPGRMLRLPQPLAKPLDRRIRAVNEIVHELSALHGAVHAHVARHPLVFDSRMWSIDRLHPNERGHRLLAALCHEALAASGWAVGPAPSLEPTSAPPSRAAQLAWMATKGTRWVLRRSTDLLPQLTMLAVSEWRHARRGLEEHLDRTMSQDIQAALAALGTAPAPRTAPGTAAPH